MAQFMITYLGGDQTSTPEEGKKHFIAYKQWLSDLGNAVVSPANPLKNTHTINSKGESVVGGVTTMSGYTLVEAKSIEDAIAMAKACPFLEINGSLEVSELVQMPM